MDKNGARGRACKIVSFVLNGSIKEGVVDAVLNKQLSPEDAALVKQEMQAIADECAAQAEFHRAIEQGEFLDNRGVNKAGDEVRLWTGSKEDVERRYSVTMYSLGYAIDFEVSTLEEAKKLYDALMCVQEVEAD